MTEVIFHQRFEPAGISPSAQGERLLQIRHRLLETFPLDGQLPEVIECASVIVPITDITG
jgi:hypothetical protein